MKLGLRSKKCQNEGKHSANCRPGRPHCRWRRRARGLCLCGSYHFPHRPQSGACRLGLPAALVRGAAARGYA